MNNWGLNDSYDLVELEMDSYDCVSSMNSDFTSLNWPNFVIGGSFPLASIAGLKVISAEIPFSWYVFTSRNNTFLFNENGGAYTTLTIPQGNYSVADLLILIPGLMSAVSTQSTTYQAVIDVNTNKITYGAPTPGTMTSFSFSFNSNGLQSPARFLGFNSGVITSTAQQIVSPNVVQISGYNYLDICSLQWGQQTRTVLPEGASQEGNTGVQLARIPVNVNSGDIIYYNDPDPTKYFTIGDVNNMQYFDLFLTMGPDLVPLDLNGIGFNVKICLLLKKGTFTTNTTATIGSGRAVKRIRVN